MRQIYPVLRQVDPKRRIAVLLNHELGFCRRVMSGILRFAEERPGWMFRDGPPDVALLNALQSWKPDGIIAHLYEGQFAAGLERIGCPVVSTTATLDRDDLPVVDVDHLETGREAGRYFLGRGFRSFAYYGSRTARFSRDREEGFREMVSGGGFAVNSLHADFLPKPSAAEIWRASGGRVESWLRKLEKPVAVFCSNDLPARRIAEVCAQLGLQVPAEVAILGVDNDTSECRLAYPQLSSIDTPAEQVGYRAAEMLSELMAGRTPGETRIFLPPGYLVTRASTDRWACEDVVVRRAMGFIREAVAEGIRVEAVARKAGVSRRQLERLFRKELRRSVLSAIHEARIEVARELLTTTKLPVSVVGERAGFRDSRRFGAVFRKLRGLSPRDFRERTAG
ncbi:XylR family transcriptional regulator [Verrucomicrobiaceae bacterium 227]